MRPPVTAKGFTLTEMIVTLAIVASVAVLAVAALSGIRKHYGRSLDVHRMKQIGATWLLYSQEHQQQLPSRISPAAFKVLAQYLGYIKSPSDWSNDASKPKNSIFRNGADEKAIRKLFVSAWDDRSHPDPLNSFSHNEYMGGTENPTAADGPEWVKRWTEIRRPEIKIFLVPAWFCPQTYTNQRFSGSTTSNPFRTARNPADKGPFPALFADGHVSEVDPAPDLTLSQINKRWLLPNSDP